MDCFALGTIPIYSGCPTISDHFDKNGIITFERELRLAELNQYYYTDLYEHVLNNYDKCWNTKMADDIVFDKIMINLSER
jgi:hypothetical protein